MVGIVSVLYLSSVLSVLYQCLVKAASIPSAEKQALQGLFNATNGDNWSWGAQPGSVWNFTDGSDPCENEWQGVSCDEDFTHVKQLQLEFYNLHGQLPDAIFTNLNLNYLSLSNNRLTGSVPHTVSSATFLQHLALYTNNLQSSIPESIASMTRLVYLDLSVNAITGYVSDSLLGIPTLQILWLSDNQLLGQVPTLTNVSSLTSIDLSDNALTGTVPLGLCSNTLNEMFLDGNLLSGTIPTTIGQHCTNLTVLYLDHNKIHGSIPSSLGELSLKLLSLDNNDLTGTLPHTLQPTLQALEISLNWLHGQMPPNFASFTQLRILSVSANRFSGTIPGYIGDNMLQLQALMLSKNQFNGTIPASVKKLSKLRSLSMAENSLTGSIPDVFEHMSTLILLNVSMNRLTNTIPNSVYNLTQALFVSLSHNSLVGTIAPAVSQLQSLTSLVLSNNLLSGSIPSTMGNMPVLEYLFLNNNKLGGTLSSALAQLSNLQVLFLQNNLLSGSLGGVFSISSVGDSSGSSTAPGLYNLTAIQLGSNRFSGPLPAGLFNLPYLASVAAVSNCFTGSIPPSVCNAQSLITLALDGIQSAPHCQQKLLPNAAFNSYSIQHPISSGIPSCIYTLPNLATLHLSGNGIVDTLPDNVAISASLVDLSLSHNQLHVTIPLSFQHRNWDLLDLSYNRLSGHLSHTLGTYVHPNTTLLLEENRISGRIPNNLDSVVDISILDSNLFECRTDRSDIPKHNSDNDKYQCGSDMLNESLYVWLGLCFACVVLLVLCFTYRTSLHNQLEVVKVWWYAGNSHADKLVHYVRLSGIVESVCIMSVMCTVLVVVVLLPVYAAFSVYYGTYDMQYAWTLSAAFLSGSVSFGVIFAVYCVLLVGVLVYLYKYVYKRDEKSLESVETSDGGAPVPGVYLRALVYVLFMAVNFVVVGGVNVAYVYIVLSEDERIVTIAQVLLSMFKVGFNSVCAPLILNRACRMLLGRDMHTLHREHASTAHESLLVQLFVSLFNNIAIPCIVVAVISTNCFVNVFQSADTVHSTFPYNGGCNGFDLTNSADDDTGVDGLVFKCVSYETLTLTTSYDPPYAYSYQCSSSIVTYYAPAFFILCIVAGFFTPVMQMLLCYLHMRAAEGSRWHTLLHTMLPRILRPVHADSPGVGATTDHGDTVQINTSATASGATDRTLRPEQLYITLLTYLGILLTFGVVFPPLAIALTVTMVLVSVYAKLRAGRYISSAAEKNPGYIEKIDAECVALSSLHVLRSCVWMIIVFAWCFYALFLFDTLGDEEGYSGAYWVLIVVPLVPLYAYIALLRVFYVYLPYVRKKPDNEASKGSDKSTENCVEMGEVKSALH